MMRIDFAKLDLVLLIAAIVLLIPLAYHLAVIFCDLIRDLWCYGT